MVKEVTTVQIQKDLSEKVEKFIKDKPVDYPSKSNFVDKAIQDKLKKEMRKK